MNCVARKFIRTDLNYSTKLVRGLSSTVVYSWGVGTEGQLGHAKFELKTALTGDSYVQEEPRKLLKSKKYESLSIGESYSLGLTKTGEVFGWGSGKFLNSVENIMEPLPIAIGKKVKHISTGPKHYALIDEEGQVYTCGEGGGWLKGGGQLGHGDRTSTKSPRLVSAFQEYGAAASVVSCGGQHTLILTDDGEVLSCGVGEYGRLGTGSTSDSLIPMPLHALADVDVVQIAAGFDHSLALTSKGHIMSWGRNQSGQLGHLDSNLDIYSMEDFPRVVDMDSIRSVNPSVTDEVSFMQIAAGNGRSAAVSTDGLLFIWGARLSNAPKVVDPHLLDNLKVIQVACGGDSSHSVIAILTEDGALWTLGDSASNMLGQINAKGKNAEPKRIAALSGKHVRKVFCGYGRHMFALVSTEE